MDELRLYHCTKFEALKGILDTKKFLPSYCLERASFMEEYTEGAYAVVCFADLTKEEVERHMASFHSDSYIVMNKRWAVEKYISPVTYYLDYSIPSVTFKEWLLEMSMQQTNSQVNNKKLLNATNMFVPFLKQYEGVYYDKKKEKFSSETRTFYLEREWRWCPLVENEEAYYLTKEMYLDKDRRRRELERLRKNYTLKFSWNDVLEIGVPEEYKKEIEKLCVKTFGVTAQQARDKIVERA